MTGRNPFALAWAQRIRARAERLKAALKVRPEAAADEYLNNEYSSVVEQKPPRPRFRVRVTDVPVDLPINPPARRKRRKTGVKSPGRPPLRGDVFLGAEVYKLMQSARISETEAINLVAARLGPSIQPKNARERVYRSLARYRAAGGQSEQTKFLQANELAGCAGFPGKSMDR